MSYVDEARAGVAHSNDKGTDALGAIQQAISCVEQAQGLLMTAIENSAKSEFTEATALYQQALTSLPEILQGIQAAIQSAETGAAGL